MPSLRPAARQQNSAQWPYTGRPPKRILNLLGMHSPIDGANQSILLPASIGETPRKGIGETHAGNEKLSK
jgi:hypothetical protein